MPPENSTLLNQGLQHFQITFKDAGDKLCNRNWDSHDHHFSYDSIGYVKQGKIWMRVNKKEADIDAGGLYYIPAKSCYSHHVVGATANVYWTHFELGLGGGALDSGLEFPVAVRATEPEKTMALFESLFRGMVSSRPGAPLRVTGLMYELVAHFIALCGPQIQPRSDDRARLMWEIAQFIGENLHRELSVELLAAKAGLNPDYFTKVFRSFFQETPIHYVLNRRELKARSLLENSEMSVKEVGLCLGFYNQNHFSAFFKGRSGYSPSGYRKLKNNLLK